jgi:hypothetical protein
MGKFRESHNAKLLTGVESYFKHTYQFILSFSHCVHSTFTYGPQHHNRSLVRVHKGRRRSISGECYCDQEEFLLLGSAHTSLSLSSSPSRDVIVSINEQSPSGVISSLLDLDNSKDGDVVEFQCF